jgi:molybdopterin/thiamine biosynthesis adenylyltransferase
MSKLRRELCFTPEDHRTLHAHLLSRAPAEEAAVLLAGASRTENAVRLYVREIHPVPIDGFAHRGSLTLSVDPSWYAPLLKRCRDEGWSFVLAHSHPFGADAAFSAIDDAGEQALMPRLFQRAPDRPHGALVMGTHRASARIWLPGERAGVRCDEVLVRGNRLASIWSGQRPDEREHDERTARQVLAFGEVGQRQLRRARIAIVGLGGLGGQMYQQLKHLGARAVTLIDFDQIATSNLSRLVYARPGDVGRSKVEVAQSFGLEVLPDSEDVAIPSDVTTDRGARAAIDADVLIVATDNLRSRLIASRVSTQYLIPLIDAGIDIDASGGRVRAIGGRVTRISPESGGLCCVGILDAVRLADEIAPAPYIRGAVVPAPSVVSLNGVIASLAVTEVLDLVTGFSDLEHTLPRSLVYDGRRGIVRSVAETIRPCGVCSLVRGAGDVQALPVQIKNSAGTDDVTAAD